MWPFRFWANALFGVALVAGLLLLGPCRRGPPATDSRRPAVVLKADESARVEIDTQRRQVRYAVRISSSQVQMRVVNEVRHATVVVKANGEVKITARPWGFTFEPGLGLVYDQGVRPLGDIQFFYAGPWGANVGLYYHSHLRIFLAGSYSLARVRLPNTSLWVGSNFADFIFGVRVRL